MKVSIKAFAAVALVTLLVPAAAGAKEAELNGPAALKGAGFFGGEVEMRATDTQRPFVVAGRGGYVGFLDLGGDLKVRCQGKGRIRAHETEQGTVYLCQGRGGRATAVGSHFRLRGFARSYGITVPEGAKATLHGRFVVCALAADEEIARRVLAADLAALAT